MDRLTEDQVFLLMNKASHGCVDIPRSEAQEGAYLQLYQQVHFGPNQLWVAEDDQIVSYLDRTLCLGCSALPDTGSETVRLLRRDHPHTHWNFNGAPDGIIPLKDATGKRRSLTLGAHDGNLLVSIDPNPLAWSAEMVRVDDLPKPATSCHLWYRGLQDPDLPSHGSWQLECTVNVKKSADSTYFCVVGWAPGGYSGIQQLPGNERVAIFSMWDGPHKAERVTLVKSGKGAIVGKFGGEGTGLKSMKAFEWHEGQDESDAETSRLRTWTCSCWYMVNGQKHFMASFRRTSEELPFPSCSQFYSFVEDFSFGGRDGHMLQRKAEFKNPKVLFESGEYQECTSATFTKNRALSFVEAKAMGGIGISPRSFFLSSGGDFVPREDMQVASRATFHCLL